MIPSYFPMDSIKRCLVSVVFLLFCIILAILSAAMVTKEWTIVKPVRVGLNVTVRSTSDIDNDRFQGLIYFGLFAGKKILNYGFGNRAFDLRIVCVAKLGVCLFSTKENSTERVKELQENLYATEHGPSDATRRGEAINESLMLFSLWVVTVASMALAGMFSFVGAVFSIANLFRASVEVVTGILGLYLWSGCSALFSIVALLSWLVHYFTKFRKNVMTVEELQQHWISEYRSCMGYSFYLVVGAFLLILLNLGLITLIIRQPWVDRKLKADLRKKLSNRRYITKPQTPRLTKKPEETVVVAV